MALTAPLAERTELLKDRLDLLRIQIDTLIESLGNGANLLDARRAITRDLRFEPRAEELQTIAKMAAHEATEGPCLDLPRRLLAIRILADRTIKFVQEVRSVEIAGMEEAAILLDDLHRETRRVESDLERAVSSDPTLDQNDRDHLLRVGDALSTEPDSLLAHSVLAHRLVELAEAVENGDLEASEPALTPPERDQLAELVAENITQESCRVGLDAIAIRSHITRLLKGWVELGSPSEDDPGRRVQRDGLHEAMQHALVALDAVSKRIQAQQDNAVVANIESLAAELREAGRGLFSIKLRLSPIVRAPYEDHDVIVDSDGLDVELREQLRESVAEEQEAAGSAPVETEEEIYVNALKNLRDGRPIQELEFIRKQRMSDAKRLKIRKIAMLAAVVVLSITSAVVNFVILPGGGTAPAKPDVRELKPVISAKRVETAGPMMITHVDNWHNLGDKERSSRVDKLGATVMDDGFQMMIVVDEYGDAAAFWDHKSGTGLMNQEPGGEAP